jgi:ABC-type glycerol-3-phosphate transport system substrate-binding protein
MAVTAVALSMDARDLRIRRMTMHKRFSSLVAVMALLALWLVPSAAFAEGQAEGAADQPMEITWQLREETSHAAQVAEEIFDVRILGNGIWNNDTEKVNLMFAAGETPEVFSAGDDQFHYRDGLTREIPLAMIQEHAPLHYQWMLDHPIALNVSRSPDSDDAYVALVGVTMSTNVPLIGFWSTRADWAENVGHPIPDYYETRWKVSTETDRTWFVPANLTLDWMEELLVLYRDGDPDGNGKVDTIPASASNVIPWSFTTLFGAFGLPMYSITVGTGGVANYQDENGDLVLQPVSPRYKKFLAHLADWYAKDLIDKEFPTMSRQDQWQKDMAGIVGVQFMSNSTYVNPTVERPPNHATLEEVAAGASVAMMPPPIGPEGYQGVQVYQAHSAISNWASLKIRHDVSDEKLAKILQIWDWRQHDPEGWMISQFGKEGVHFTWSGEPGNSKPVRTSPEDLEKNHPDEPSLGRFFHYPYGYHEDMIRWIYSPQFVRIWDNWFAPGHSESYHTRPYKWDLFTETEMKAIADRQGEGLNTLANEFFMQVVTGQLDLDAEWDNYVARWMAEGGDQVYEAMQNSIIIKALHEGRIEY